MGFVRSVSWLALQVGFAASVLCETCLQAPKSFVRWPVQERRLADDPLDYVSSLNTETDKRRERRVLEPDEFDRLMATTAAIDQQLRGQSGGDRAMLYLTLPVGRPCRAFCKGDLAVGPSAGSETLAQQVWPWHSKSGAGIAITSRCQPASTATPPFEVAGNRRRTPGEERRLRRSTAACTIRR